LDEVQTFSLSASPSTLFRVSVEYPAGTVRMIPFRVATDAVSGTDAAVTAALIQAAFRSNDVDGSFSDVEVAGEGVLGDPQDFAVTFANVGGNLPLMALDVVDGSGAVAASPVAQQDGTAPDAECSRRGRCDYATGSCVCFRGWGGSVCRQRIG
jgi:hypothetical protein